MKILLYIVSVMIAFSFSLGNVAYAGENSSVPIKINKGVITIMNNTDSTISVGISTHNGCPPIDSNPHNIKAGRQFVYSFWTASPRNQCINFKAYNILIKRPTGWKSCIESTANNATVTVNKRESDILCKRQRP